MGLKPKDRELLHTVGLWFVMNMPTIKLHYAMLMTLMEIWDIDTSTFLLPMGEMIVTLENMYHILHLPIRVEIVRYQVDHTATNYRME